MADRSDVSDADWHYQGKDEWHDPVTGLPSAGRFLEHLQRLLAKPAPRSVAMLMLEVTDFAALRAQVGKPGCDELLRTIAERLHEAVPEPNLVTRLRGAEFGVVLHDLGPEVAPEALAARLLERASAPCPSGSGLAKWAVVGALALWCDRAETAIQLFDRATQALARAKRRSAG